MGIANNHAAFRGPRLVELIDGNEWMIPDFFSHVFLNIVDEIRRVLLPLEPSEDLLVWTESSTGELSFRDAYDFYSGTQPSMTWCKHLCKSFIPLRVSMLAWRLLHDRMPTHD